MVNKLIEMRRIDPSKVRDEMQVGKTYAVDARSSDNDAHISFVATLTEIGYGGFHHWSYPTLTFANGVRMYAGTIRIGEVP